MLETLLGGHMYSIIKIIFDKSDGGLLKTDSYRTFIHQQCGGSRIIFISILAIPLGNTRFVGTFLVCLY